MKFNENKAEVEVEHTDRVIILGRVIFHFKQF